MLGKLLKHEFKATGRTFLPIYGVLIVVTLLNRGLIALSDIPWFKGNPAIKIAGTLITFISVLLLIAMLFGTVFLILQRFYKHLYSSEGYLSFTLPVTPNQHLIAKITTSFVWIVCSGLMVFVYVFFMALSPDVLNVLQRMWEDVINMFANMPGYGWLLMAEFLLMAVVTVVAMILQFYASISLGQRIMPEKRILGAILSYFCIQFAMQALMLILMFFAALVGSGFWDQVMDFMNTANGPQMLQIVILLSLGFNLVLAGVFYFINHNTMQKHLNLE